MFNVPNINRMERAYLSLLQFNTIVSASQYASYYFSLRAALRNPAPREPTAASGARNGNNNLPSGHNRENFRSRYYMAISVAGPSKLQEKSAAIAQQSGAHARPIEQQSELRLGLGDHALYSTSF